MKSYTQFIKEVNTSVYGEVTVGSKPSTITKKSISSGIDKAIKNIGSGKGESTVAKKGGYGLSGGVNVSMTGSSSKSPTPTTTKTTPPPTKVKPDKTKDPKPTTTKVTPTTSTPTPSTNVLTKGSGSSTSTSTSTKSPTKIRDPRTAKISDIRMGRM